MSVLPLGQVGQTFLSDPIVTELFTGEIISLLIQEILAPPQVEVIQYGQD